MLLACALATPAYAAGDCAFVLGFKSLHDAIPVVVGDCVDNERPEIVTSAGSTLGSGNRVQHTSRGLLVWRRADDSTAFTDGFETWLAGPNGTERRLNSERLPWESPSDDASPILGSIATELLRLVNEERRNHGLTQLDTNPQLAASAEQRSREMLASGKLAHYDSSGRLQAVRLLQDKGIPFGRLTENVGEQNTILPADAHRAFMDSAPHRANILDSAYTQAGVGVAGPSPSGRYYYTELFLSQ